MIPWPVYSIDQNFELLCNTIYKIKELYSMALAWSKFRKTEITPARFTGGELKVLLYLAIKSDADNLLTCTYESLANDLGFSRRYAIQCVKQLWKAGFIEYRAEKGRFLRIFLKKGWGYGPVEEPIPVPPGWHATYSAVHYNFDEDVTNSEEVSHDSKSQGNI